MKHVTHATVLWPSRILSRTTRVSQHLEDKTNLDLLEQEIVSGSGISWAICKSAPWPRYITTPASYHSVFLQAGCPSCCPTNSIKALKRVIDGNFIFQQYAVLMLIALHSPTAMVQKTHLRLFLGNGPKMVQSFSAELRWWWDLESHTAATAWVVSNKTE